MSSFWAGYFTGGCWNDMFSAHRRFKDSDNKVNVVPEEEYESLRNHALDLVDACNNRSVVLYAREAQISYLLDCLKENGIDPEMVYPDMNRLYSEQTDFIKEVFKKDTDFKRRGVGASPVFPDSPLAASPIQRQNFPL